VDKFISLNAELLVNNKHNLLASHWLNDSINYSVIILPKTANRPRRPRLQLGAAGGCYMFGRLVLALDVSFSIFFAYFSEVERR
jgi:hypothetical protein